MLKQINSDILIGLLLASLFWVGVIAWTSPPPARDANDHCEGTKAECARASVDERLARYTLWLALLTGGLVLTAIGQGYFLLRSDKTARIAAAAAEKSADANIAQMRAYVDVSGAKIHGFDQDGPSLVQVSITNSGSTVAFEVVGQGGVAIGDAAISSHKGDLRPANYVIDHMSKGAMARNSVFETFNHIPAVNLSAEIKAAIRSGSQAIFAYGEFKYKDSLKNPHTTSYRLMFGGPAGLHPEGKFVVCEEGNESD